MTDRLTMRRPDDWHVHLRDDAMMAAIVPYTARSFARAIVMPNLPRPITSAAAANAYRARIMAAVDGRFDFNPLMTCYLTDASDADDIRRGFETGAFVAAKLYPAHATTNSAHGVSDIRHIRAVLAMMEVIGMPLLIHGEVTDPAVDIFDREAVFIDRIFAPLIRDFPALKTVFEHITTADAAAFVLAAGDSMAATITPQHLHINRNAMFDGGLRPHAYCLPVAKRERHRLALRAAATSGSPRFFLGTDSAPHEVGRKESACGCAGIFNAPFALESYATVFDEAGALDRLEAFAALNGARFYGLPLNEARVTLERGPCPVPDNITVDGGAGAGGTVVPFHAGQTLGWRIDHGAPTPAGDGGV
jgi:dihydroorotase